VPSALTARRASALILGWGALDEGENQASDGRREGRGTASEKPHWRPVAPTFLSATKGLLGVESVRGEYAKLRPR